jgi:hypothetical protein
MSGSWQRRLHRPAGRQPLDEVQAAARQLAEHAPGKARVVFETVTSVAIISSALIGGALGLIHLYRNLFPKHKENSHTPEPAGGDGSPPRRRPHTATAFADGNDGYEKKNHRSR